MRSKVIPPGSDTPGKIIAAAVGGELLDKHNVAWKIVNGEWVGKKAVKDLDYKGHRYGWPEDFVNYHELD